MSRARTTTQPDPAADQASREAAARQGEQAQAQATAEAEAEQRKAAEGQTFVSAQAAGGAQTDRQADIGGTADRTNDQAGDHAGRESIQQTEDHAEAEAGRGDKGSAEPMAGGGAQIGTDSIKSETARIDGVQITRPNQRLATVEDQNQAVGGFPVIANVPPGSEPLQLDPKTGKPHEKQVADEDQERLDRLAEER